MAHRVLVVDDSADIHELVQVGLMGEPIELTSCLDGAAGLAAARRSAPDLLLLDVDMPGTNGFDVCRQFKADVSLASIPVVFLTGASSADEKLLGLELGATDYVTKPFDLVELRARVRAALRTKGLMDRLAHEAAGLRAHADVLRLVARDAPLTEVKARLMAMAEAEHPGCAAALVLLQQGRLELTAPRLDAELRDVMDRHLVRITAGLCSDLASRGATVGACDPAADPRWTSVGAVAASRGLRSCWHALIRSANGDVLGMFALFGAAGAAPAEPDEAGRLFLDKVSSLLAIAMEHWQLTDRLEHRAEHDALTGLPNRAHLDRHLQAAVSAAAANGRRVGVLFVDVDRFKVINDTMGHLVGDLLLCRLVERMQAAVGDAGLIGRLGGDEFAIVLSDLRDRAEAVRVGRQIIEQLQTPFHLADQELFVTVSLGLSCFPEDGRDTVTLQKNADTAMYRAKHGGRNALQCFDRTMEAPASDRLSLEADLHRALERDELTLHYQPLVDAAGATVGSEALLRWQHPSRGTIPPGKFIPLAEEIGTIVPIGAWVIRRAAAQVRAWLDAGADPRSAAVAVNVSVAHFMQPEFVDLIESVLAEHRLPAHLLDLELTESLLMTDPRSSAAKLERLRRVGVKVSIDDFGTGYSSLAYLRDLPVDAVKVDRSFVSPIGGTDAPRGKPGANAAVVRAITSMAHALDLTVVAEGVETEAQRGFLTAVGCDRMQGYLFGRPAAPQRLPPVGNPLIPTDATAA